MNQPLPERIRDVLLVYIARRRAGEIPERHAGEEVERAMVGVVVARVREAGGTSI